VILPSSGQVFHRILEVPFPLSSSPLNQLMNWINDRIRSLKAEEIRGVLQKLEELPFEQQELARQVLCECQNILLKVGEEDVVVEGASRILRQPEFKNLDRLESLLVLLEERGLLLELLQTVTTLPGVTVLIGSENPRGEWHACSVIATRYSAGEGAYGSIGVIGPTRMEYWFVIPTVKLVARHLSDFLTRLSLS
jgi:heat-inducible transcriptional repressor